MMLILLFVDKIDANRHIELFYRPIRALLALINRGPINVKKN